MTDADRLPSLAVDRTFKENRSIKVADTEVTPESKMRNRIVILGGIVVVLVIALYFLPSIFLRDYVEDYLAEYGMQAEGLEEVQFNVFSMGLETGPLVLKRGPDQIADLDGLTLFLGLAPLSQQRVDVTGARLTGLSVAVERDADGNISVLNLPKLVDDSGEESAWVKIRRYLWLWTRSGLMATR